MTSHAAELAIARLAAERAGQHIAKHWDTTLQVEHKGAVDLVTAVDLASEKIILDIIGQHFPDDRLIGEELGASGPPDAERAWHLDPLDGTTNFSHGLPHFCVSIALCDTTGPLVGVVHDPIRRWTFYATRGGGAFLDGRVLSVSSTGTLGKALFATGFPYDRWTNPDNNTQAFSALLRQTQGGRRAGSAALDLCWLAAGWLDGYWEDRLKSWDIAAGGLIALEAGAVVTQVRGAPFAVAQGNVLAANPDLYPKLLEALKAARTPEVES